MPVNLPRWVYVWVAVASLLVGFDCLYVFSISFKTVQIPVISALWGWYGTSDTQYSASGAGIEASNGWIASQSAFNVVELALQLLFLFALKRGSVKALLTLFFVSVATLWKTLLYMSIIYFSSDPVAMVPGLSCLGMKPLSDSAGAVAESLARDNCAMQLFKFQFNFWWIVFPALVVYVCCAVISDKLEPRGSGRQAAPRATAPAPALTPSKVRSTTPSRRSTPSRRR